ncbi:hypothetical protein AVEN_247779-1 [Araneus ventricosus]|uniref:OTU domain-containing protein n=1 Tax=Araneus ventricosus TaxID=182803 RepID=A0A4Y2PR92_ARAVE|nr:hypothetical protein AVEN_247779-1 [Araneus ventricosus]
MLRVVGASELSEGFTILFEIVYRSQQFHQNGVPKILKIPIVGDGNCLFRASFCIYGSEDFHAEIREKDIQNITTKRGSLKDFAILKEYVVFKEYEIYFWFYGLFH